MWMLNNLGARGSGLSGMSLRMSQRRPQRHEMPALGAISQEAEDRDDFQAVYKGLKSAVGAAEIDVDRLQEVIRAINAADRTREPGVDHKEMTVADIIKAQGKGGEPLLLEVLNGSAGLTALVMEQFGQAGSGRAWARAWAAGQTALAEDERAAQEVGNTGAQREGGVSATQGAGDTGLVAKLRAAYREGRGFLSWNKVMIGNSKENAIFGPEHDPNTLAEVRAQLATLVGGPEIHAARAELAMEDKKKTGPGAAADKAPDPARPHPGGK